MLKPALHVINKEKKGTKFKKEWILLTAKLSPMSICLFIWLWCDIIRIVVVADTMGKFITYESRGNIMRFIAKNAA